MAGKAKSGTEATPSKAVFIRVPDAMHRELKVRVAQSGASLQDVVMAALSAYLEPGRHVVVSGPPSKSVQAFRFGPKPQRGSR